MMLRSTIWKQSPQLNQQMFHIPIILWTDTRGTWHSQPCHRTIPRAFRSTINPATKFVDFLRQTLENILVVSIDNCQNQVNTNKATSQLEAFKTELLHEQMTSDTANQMDLSPSVSPQELEELIAKSTSKAVSSLTREIQSLKSKLENSTSNRRQSTTKSTKETQKNSSKRGQQGASLKKKQNDRNTSRSPSPSTQSSRGRGRSRSTKPPNKRHGGKNKDTSNKRRKGSSKPKKTKSPKRRTNSRRN